MVPRRARFIWHGGQDGLVPPALLRMWVDDGADPSAAPVLLIPDRGAAWADIPIPGRDQRWAAALVTTRPELGTATRAASLGADDVVVLTEGEAMIAARLRRLADSAVLRRETQRRRRVAAAFQRDETGPLRRRASDRPAPARPAVLFVGAAGGDQLQAVNALGGWHVAAYAETLDHAVRHLAGGEYRAVVISGVTDPSSLGPLFGYIGEIGAAAAPTLVLLRPENAPYSASQAVAAGADDVIAPSDPQDLIHQRLTRAVTDAARRAELRLHQGFEPALDTVSGRLGYSAFHAYVADRLERDDVTSSALVVVELEGLDRINLRHGFVTGDRALAAAGAALASRLRAEDLLGRIGGGAFGIWVDHMGAEALPLLATRLQDAVRRARIGADDADALGARVGWALPQAGPRNALTLSHEARAQARRHALRAVG